MARSTKEYKAYRIRLKILVSCDIYELDKMDYPALVSVYEDLKRQPYNGRSGEAWLPPAGLREEYVSCNRRGESVCSFFTALLITVGFCFGGKFPRRNPRR